mmetsp:Transcript_16353/g.35461  ORF Transcript_16353/g.35461 Transcript_16353/m.35461 type:complete len:82 (+) Transcript_16353:333-578(+)
MLGNLIAFFFLLISPCSNKAALTACKTGLWGVIGLAVSANVAALLFRPTYCRSEAEHRNPGMGQPLKTSFEDDEALLGRTE